MYVQEKIELLKLAKGKFFQRQNQPSLMERAGNFVTGTANKLKSDYYEPFMARQQEAHTQKAMNDASGKMWTPEYWNWHRDVSKNLTGPKGMSKEDQFAMGDYYKRYAPMAAGQSAAYSGQAQSQPGFRQAATTDALTTGLLENRSSKGGFHVSPLLEKDNNPGGIKNIFKRLPGALFNRKDLNTATYKATSQDALDSVKGNIGYYKFPNQAVGATAGAKILETTPRYQGAMKAQTGEQFSNAKLDAGYSGSNKSKINSLKSEYGDIRNRYQLDRLSNVLTDPKVKPYSLLTETVPNAIKNTAQGIGNTLKPITNTASTMTNTIKNTTLKGIGQGPTPQPQNIVASR